MNSTQYKDSLNRTAPLVEADIEPLLKLFNFNIPETYSFIQNKSMIEQSIHQINIDNTQPLIGNDLVISIFNIYDDNNILNSNYGSTYAEFIQTAYTFNYYFLKYKIEEPLYYSSFNCNVVDNMAVLNYFLNEKTKYNTLILS